MQPYCLSHGFLRLRPLRPLRSDSLLSAVYIFRSLFPLLRPRLPSFRFFLEWYSSKGLAMSKFIHFFCCVNFFINFAINFFIKDDAKIYKIYIPHK